MTIKALSLGIIVSVTTFVTGCSSLYPPGMPSLDTGKSVKLVKAVPGRDYTVVPIDFNIIRKIKGHYKHNNKMRATRKGHARGAGGYKYILAPQDILSITVWDHPELTIPAGEFRSATSAGHQIGPDGTIFFPYAGRIRAGGRTTAQVRTELEKKLAKFITKPQVGVAVAAYRSQKTFISGKVNKPGTYPVTDVPLTIRGIIAKSGGLSKDAADTALFIHNKKQIPIDLEALYRKGDNSQNYVMRSGDSLHIDKLDPYKKVFVMGEVLNPGNVTIDRFGLSLAEALSTAKGVNEETANPMGVFVVRQVNPKKPTIYQLQMTSVHAMALAEQFSLQPRDVVYVTATPITRWNRVISKLLPTFTSAGAARAVVK